MRKMLIVAGLLVVCAGGLLPSEARAGDAEYYASEVGWDWDVLVQMWWNFAQDPNPNYAWAVLDTINTMGSDAYASCQAAEEEQTQEAWDACSWAWAVYSDSGPYWGAAANCAYYGECG